MSKKNYTLDPFQTWAHRWGRIGTLIALAYMISVPFIVLSYYNCMPSLGSVFNVATFGILAIYIPVGISEALSYTPLMGASSYLGFITGNIMNLKLPCAVNALKIAGKEANTPEGDVVASIGVAASSIMTVVILTIAALLVNLISPVFELPAVKTMSNYLLPALFGALIVQFGLKAKGHTLVMLAVGCFMYIAVGKSPLGINLFGWLSGASNYLPTLVCVFVSIGIMMVTSKKKAKA